MNMNFNQVEMVLFDSTVAQFKLSVKGTFTRERNDGSTANLVYKNNYTNNRTNKTVTTLNINPNIYLVFGYKVTATKLAKLFIHHSHNYSNLERTWRSLRILC